MQRTSDAHLACNCLKSKCLKQYCICFAAGKLCGDSCKCKGCDNHAANIQIVRESRHNTIARSGTRAPCQPGCTTVAKQTRGEVKYLGGCACRKSRCLKKYCVCFSSGAICSASCRCVATLCKNGSGSARPTDTPRPVQRQATPIVSPIASPDVAGHSSPAASPDVAGHSSPAAAVPDVARHSPPAPAMGLCAVRMRESAADEGDLRHAPIVVRRDGVRRIKRARHLDSLRVSVHRIGLPPVAAAAATVNNPQPAAPGAADDLKDDFDVTFWDQELSNVEYGAALQHCIEMLDR